MKSGKKQLVGFLVFAVVLICSGVSTAADVFWHGEWYEPNDFWSGAPNWYIDDPCGWVEYGDTPGEWDNAFVFNEGDPCHAPHVVAPGAIAMNVTVGKWLFPGVLHIDAGGELTVGSAMGTDDGENDGKVVVDGGTLNVPELGVGAVGAIRSLYVINSGTVNVNVVNMNIWGRTKGKIDMYGGTINVTGAINFGSGCGADDGLTLYDGVCNTATMGGADPNGPAVIDIHNGTLILDANQVGLVYNWVNEGLIVARDGTGTVVADFNETNPDKTTVIAEGGYECPTPPVGDINGDCLVDLADFAELAETWLDCGRIPDHFCP